MQVSEVHERKLGQGLDNRNAENQLMPGFWEILKNAETEGDIVKKRKGYQQLGGYLPFRIQRVDGESDTNRVCFTLDDYVDLSRIRSSPIVVRGIQYSFNTPDFPENTLLTQYYPSFDVTIRRTPSAAFGNDFIISIPQREHGHTSWIQHANFYESTSISDLSNERVYAQHSITSTDLATTTLANTSFTTNRTGSFIHASIDASEIGVNHYYPTNGSGEPLFTSKVGTTLTMSFDISSTDLQSVNLIPTIYRYEFGNTVEKIIPDEITIDGSIFTVTITNATDTSDYFYVTTAVPDSQVVAGQISDAVQSVDIPNITPFTSYAVYTIDNTGVKEYVYEDSAVYDDTTGTLTLSFQTGTALNYQIYYQAETVLVNELCVETENINVIGTSDVEMDLYGLDPLEVITEENRNHWVTHIDTYRSANQNELLAGVAGNEYRLESPGLSPLLPNLRLTLFEDQYLSPLFLSTGQTFVISAGRGYILCDNGQAGPEVTDIEYQDVTGFVKFTLACPNLDDSNFTVSTLDNDLLTVANAGYSIMNGEHAIESITINTGDNTVDVFCTVEGVTNSDFDETDVCGYAQVYTSYLTLDSAPVMSNPLTAGSTLSLGGDEYTVRGNSFQVGFPERVYLSKVIDTKSYAAGLVIVGSVTSDVIPVRSSAGPNVGNYVKGDLIQYTGLPQSVRIKDIIQLENQAVTIAGNQITFSGATTALNLQVGQRILLATEGLEGGVVTITSIDSGTTISVDKTYSATSGRFIGDTFELDEVIEVAGTVDNSLSFTQTGRWHSIPKVSVPTNFPNADQAVKYPFNVFETTSQEFIQSTMVSDNMYMTNGADSLIKYDGANLSRAGLFRWEGATFVRVQSSGPTAADGTIAKNSLSVSGTGVSGENILTGISPVLAAGSFTSGQTVVTDTGQSVTVEAVDTINGTIRVSPAFDSAVASLSAKNILKYYFRLNIIDNNNNIIGSAVTGSDNSYTIDLIENFTTVGMKLAKPPNLDLLDYNRLEYEIYRTKQDGAVFFKVATLQIQYTDTKPFVLYQDTISDINLVESDPVSTSLFGAELATAIDEPMRAKFITSANNRLVLGNLRDSHKASVRIYRPSEELNDSELEGLSFTFENANDTVTYEFVGAGIPLQVSTTGDLIGTALNSDTWVYIYTKTNQDVSPELLGWRKTTGVNEIDYSGPAITPADNLFICPGTRSSIPITSDSDFNDGDAGYQNGVNLLRVPIKLCNAIVATQNDLSNFSFNTEGRTDVTLGTFVVRSLTNTPFTLTITHDTAKDLFDVASVFINNTLTSSGNAIASVEQNYRSRMLVSFPNFAEIFDRPRAIIAEDSQSVIDVNSADGQEITGIIPFFGDSTSQDSRKQDIVICFKENSIYAVNVTTRVITKIDSRGVGCNAPRSIVAVPNGIIFASNSGIYRINRSFDVIWVGKYIDREWKEQTNLNNLSLAAGHVYPTEQQYRLSVAAASGEAATKVYVYDFGDEQAGQVGGWTIFDNIPSTGWASDGSESYFASNKGKVFTIRNTNTDADFRDDDQPIIFEGVYRGMDFGAPGKRKIVRAIVSHFRVLRTDSGTSMDVAVDLKNEFSPTTSFVLQDSVEDGLSTTVASKVQSIRQSIPLQKGIYFQVRYSNSTKDMPVALAGITFLVAGLDHRGILQASDT